MLNAITKSNSKKAQGLLLLCLCCMSASGAQAQSNDILNRLNQLENEIQTLNRAVYKGEPLPQPAYGAPTPMPADTAMQENVEIRLQQMETEIRELTGRVEEQSYKVQQMEERLINLEKDVATMPAQQPPMAQQQPPMQPQGVPYASNPAYQPEPAAGNGSLQYTDQYGMPAMEAPPQPTAQNPLYQSETAQQNVLQEQASISPQATTPAALYENSYSILKGGDYEGAQRSFQSFLEQYPDHSLASNATYWLGETYYVRNRYEDAARIFAKNYQEHPNGSKTPDSLLKLALSLEGMGKKPEACIALNQLKTEFPGVSSSVLNRADKEISNLGC